MDRAFRAAACLLAVGLLLAAAGLSPARAWSGNLLTNPGLEQGNAQWWGYASWDQAEPYLDAKALAENPHSGSYTLRVGPSAGGRAQSYFKPRPNTTYRIGAWGMVSQSGETGWVGIEYYDIYGSRFAPGIEFTETSYTYKELEITTPATIDTLKAYAWKNDGPGYLYVDDVSLVGPDLIYSPGDTTYYVDSAGGLDSNSGTDPLFPWLTLSKMNRIVYASGDRLLLKAGSVFYGSLDPLGSGAAGNPITIDIYGDGAKPVIDGQGLVTAPMRLYSQEYWEINNLELLNRDPAASASASASGSPQRTPGRFTTSTSPTASSTTSTASSTTTTSSPGVSFSTSAATTSRPNGTMCVSPDVKSTPWTAPASGSGPTGGTAAWAIPNLITGSAARTW